MTDLILIINGGNIVFVMISFLHSLFPRKNEKNHFKAQTAKTLIFIEFQKNTKLIREMKK